MIAYCEDKIECRRKLVLRYFGEDFDKTKCFRSCDNCQRNTKFIEKDITADVRNLVELSIIHFQITLIFLVGLIFKDKITLIHIAEVFRGGKNAKIKKAGHDTIKGHGSGSHYLKSDIDRILRYLISLNIVEEVYSKSRAGFIVAHAKLGSEAWKFKNGKNSNELVTFQFEESRKKKEKPTDKEPKKKVQKNENVKPKEKGKSGNGNANGNMNGNCYMNGARNNEFDGPGWDDQNDDDFEKLPLPKNQSRYFIMNYL